MEKHNKENNFNSSSPNQKQLNDLLGHYQNKRFDDAEKLAVYITELFPKHHFAWKVLGAIFWQTGRKIEAVEANKKAVVLSPQDAESQSNLGAMLQELGRLDEAETCYTKAILLNPDFPEPHNNMGNTLKELGRLEEAEASYIKAIALKSNYAEAHYNLGITLKELGRLEEAEASYINAIKLKPDYAEAYSNLGNTLKQLGRLDEAEASYSKAIASKPNFIEALTSRSYLLFDNGQFESALKDADATDLSEENRALPLISLFALGRVDEIYKRIENYAKVDANNISIAAFAAFISKVEKKPTAYNFCPNPLDFINVSNLSSHISNSTRFAEEIIRELNNIETIWEPFGKSTISGFQSLNGINLFKRPSGKIAQLKSIIINELDAYRLKFQNQPCSYIQQFPFTHNLFGWKVILKHQGHQTAHIHPGGWLSGVIYLKVVPCLGKNEGAIEFSLNGKRYQHDNSPSLTFQPKVGDIVFFPSSLHHKTIPFTTDADRIIISFDLMPQADKS